MTFNVFSEQKQARVRILHQYIELNGILHQYIELNGHLKLEI